MDLSKLTYNKNVSDKEEIAPVGAPIILPEKVEEPLPLVEQIKGYSKEEGERTPALFFIISGGEERERNYISAIEKKNEFQRIRMIFISSPKGEGGLKPKAMMEKLIDANRKGTFEIDAQSYNWEEYDKVYLVSDVDEFAEDLKELLCTPPDISKTYHWAISNPCFEIWLYYSYFSELSAEVQSLEQITINKRSCTLKTLNGESKAGGIDPRKAFEEMPTASANSKIHYAEDEFGIPVLFATQMHFLADDVLSTLGTKYEEWKAKKLALIDRFKKGIN